MNLNLNNSEISRFAEHISAEPSSSWHHIEIYPGKDFLFHHVEHPVWCCLTRVESLVRQVIVLKLDHHQLLVSNEERAWVIASVGSVKFLSFHVSNQIVDKHWTLGKYASCCFSCWKVCTVTYSKDIVPLIVLQSLGVDINEAISCS